MTCCAVRLIRRSNRRTGYTLVELLCASVIGLTLLTTLGQLFWGTSEALLMITAQGTVRMQLVNALNAMGQDVFGASQRLPSCCGGTYAETANTTLILQVPSVDATGNVIDDQAQFDSIVYQFDAAANQLKRIVQPGALSSRPAQTRPVGNHMTGFSFTWLSDAGGTYRVQVTLIATRSEHGRPYTETSTRIFALRNWSR